VGYIYTIKFQKRGLPHAHILIILGRDDKPKTVVNIDQICCAEIPDPVANPLLYTVVITNIIHRKCGELNKKAVYIKNKNETCRAKFPKAFLNQTIITEDSYPRYRRRNNRRRVKIGPHVYTNQDIVPYNPYLSLRFNAHINIKIAGSIKAVKYMYKYVFKGGDRATATIHSEEVANQIIDKIKEHVDARWLGPPKAL